MSAFAAASGPILLAHRGARTMLPDNSLEAFEAALRAGADGIETDARVSADGHVVLAHDADGRGTARVDRAVAECTLSELKAWDIGSGPDVVRAGTSPVRMPTLVEALAAFPDALFNVDLKAHAPAAMDAALRAVARVGAQQRVLLTSFSTTVLQRVRAAGYAGPTGIAQLEAIAVLLLRRPAPVGAWRLQIPERFGALALDRRWVIERARAVGLSVDYWVVNDPLRAQALLALGAEGIVTDDPARLAPVIAATRSKG
jgi:glycerophosphoryl diester phosphodiesterase